MKTNFPKQVHFVGIGGIGMSALAQHLAATGHVVTGSDRTPSKATELLQSKGVTVFEGHSAKNLGEAQLVVRSEAVPESNVEIAEARLRGIEVISREEALGGVFNGFPLRVAVAGTHGKTTVTAMVDRIFSACKRDCACFVGGMTPHGNYRFGQSAVVAEACEYRQSFRFLQPDISVVLNAEMDHPDCYANKRQVLDAFKGFLNNTAENGFAVVGAGVPKRIFPKHCRVVTFGKRGMFGAKQVEVGKDGCCAFTLTAFGRDLLRIRLPVAGRHNVDNALAAIAVAYCAELPLLQAAHSLQGFEGVDRRWTQIPCKFTDVVTDYAHHPTEIAASLATARAKGYNRIVAVFQPHTYTRTKALENKFASCFGAADKVGFLPIFAAREQPIEGVSSDRLCRLAQKHGVNATYLSNFDQAAEFVRANASEGDVALILGAGDVADLAEMLRG